MTGGPVLRHVIAALAVLSFPVSAQSVRYTPPRLVQTALPAMPAPMVVGGGEVLIEGIVDTRGVPTRIAILRSTPPFTQMVLDAFARWQFEPARVRDEKGVEHAVDAPVTVAARFRPPTLYDGPVAGESARDHLQPSADVAYPLGVPTPAYPPRALDGSTVLFELSLDESGRITSSKSVAMTPGFEGVTRDAVASMRFRGASYRARPVPATAYVIFGFRSPVVGAPTPPCDPRIGKCPPPAASPQSIR